MNFEIRATLLSNTPNQIKQTLTEFVLYGKHIKVENQVETFDI
jgi:hypothetical protein